MGGRPWRVGAAVAAFLLSLATTASAERTYAVQIRSEPEGARIYLDDPDSDPIGETPYEGDLAAGDYTVILQADGYETAIEAITVSRSRRRQSFSFELEKKPMGYVKLRPADAGEDFSDSTILIDDVERDVSIGEKIEVPAGAHKLEVVREGYKTYQAFFELEAGQTQGISVNFVPADGDDAGDGGGEVIEKKKKKEEPSGPTPPAKVELLSAWGGIEVAGRTFAYNDTSMNLRDYNFLGARFRLGVELHPLVSLGRWAGGLGVGANFGILLGPRLSTNDGNTPTDPSDDLSASNSWTDYHVDLRYRLDFKEKYWVAAAVGYGAQTFTFSKVDPSLQEQLAGVDYRFLDIGLLAGARVGPSIDLSAGFDLFQVTQAGEVQTRFTSASIAAFGFHAGLSIPVYKKLELAARLYFNQFSYQFGEPPAGETYVAQSATDKLFGLTLGVLYHL